MKNNLIRVLHWLFVGLLCFQVIYIPYTLWMVTFNPARGSSYAVVGEFRMLPDVWSEFTAFSNLNPENLHARVFENHLAHAAFRYPSLSSASVYDHICTLADLLNYFAWMMVTYMFIRIFRSLSRSVIFDTANIRRLRIIAVIIGLLPLIAYVKNLTFAAVVRSRLLIPDHHVSLSYSYEIFRSLLIMLLIFVVIEVFRKGQVLQKETELTI